MLTFYALRPLVIGDLWRQKDIYTCGYQERWETEVAPHGCVFVKLTPVNKNFIPDGFDKNIRQKDYRPKDSLTFGTESRSSQPKNWRTLFTSFPSRITFTDFV